jgi:hypothetical protein
MRRLIEIATETPQASPTQVIGQEKHNVGFHAFRCHRRGSGRQGDDQPEGGSKHFSNASQFDSKQGMSASLESNFDAVAGSATLAEVFAIVIGTGNDRRQPVKRLDMTAKYSRLPSLDNRPQQVSPRTIDDSEVSSRKPVELIFERVVMIVFPLVGHPHLKFIFAGTGSNRLFFPVFDVA